MEASLDLWDSKVGAWMRNHPDCLGAKAAASGTTWVVVSEWSSRDAYEATLASPDYQKVMDDIASAMGLASHDVEPAFLFEGEVVATV